MRLAGEDESVTCASMLACDDVAPSSPRAAPSIARAPNHLARVSVNDPAVIPHTEHGFACGHVDNPTVVPHSVRGLSSARTDQTANPRAELLLTRSRPYCVVTIPALVCHDAQRGRRVRRAYRASSAEDMRSSARARRVDVECPRRPPRPPCAWLRPAEGHEHDLRPAMAGCPHGTRDAEVHCGER